MVLTAEEIHTDMLFGNQIRSHQEELGILLIEHERPATHSFLQNKCPQGSRVTPSCSSGNPGVSIAMAISSVAITAKNVS